MKTIVMLPISLVWISLICFTANSFAAVPVGAVAAIRGEAVAVGADKQQRVLQLESPIFLEDTLKTGERGRLQVLFRDSTIISIGPASEMIVANYEWNGSTGKMENRVKEGFFHIMGGNIAKQSPENFTTKTPIATIGIRGSTYAFNLMGEDLNVVFIGGTGIFVVNAAGRLDITRPGFGTSLNLRDSRIPVLKKFTEKELSDIMPPEKPAPREFPAKKERPEEPASPSLPDTPDRPERPQRPEQPATSQDVDREINRNQQIIRRPRQIPGFKGSYMNLLTNPEENFPVVNDTVMGKLEGTSAEGHITARGESGTGALFPLEFDIPPVTPGERYTGFSTREVRLPAFPLSGFSPEAPVDTNLTFSPQGEFAILTVPMEPVSSFRRTYHYGMLGFLGLDAPQALRPDTGIYRYSGPVMGFSHQFTESLTEGGTGRIHMHVNWHNNRFIGFNEPGPEETIRIFFFGSVNRNEPVLDHAVFLGTFNSPADSINPLPGNGSESPGENPAPITWIVGSDNGFGRFYGSAYQGFGGTASGKIVEIEPAQTRYYGDWNLIAAGFRSPEIRASLTGRTQLQGFISGVGDNMSAPHLAPRFFLNRTASDFRFEIDRDAGTVTGTISASDFSNEARGLSNLRIGVNDQSAYVDAYLFAALIGSDAGVVSSGRTGGLKPYGNHFQSGERENAIANHADWGYWEIAYTDPATGDPIHVHSPGSLWIAGEPTPADAVRGLIESRQIGRYEGQAKGVLTTVELPHMTAIDGRVNLNIDFSPAAPSPLSGRIFFNNPDINLVIDRGNVTTSGFSGTFADTLRSELNGGFFGPNAASVAGNFAAALTPGRAVSGIFGADRINR